VERLCAKLSDAVGLDTPTQRDAMLPSAPSHRLLIVTDAWLPQVNGVVGGFKWPSQHGTLLAYRSTPVTDPQGRGFR